MKTWLTAGGWVMVPLVICSVLALTVILERMIFHYVWNKKRDFKKLGEVKSLIQYCEFEYALQSGKNSKDPVVRVLMEGLEQRDSNLTQVFRSVCLAPLNEMKRFLSSLDTIVTISPMLGILGTVVGIIQSFGFLSNRAIDNQEGIMAGLSSALVTTEFGLIIAIPSVICLNYFQSKADKFAEEMETSFSQLEVACSGKMNLTATSSLPD